MYALFFGVPLFTFIVCWSLLAIRRHARLTSLDLGFVHVCRAFTTYGLSTEAKQRFYVLGGECNYLLQVWLRLFSGYFPVVSPR